MDNNFSPTVNINNYYNLSAAGDNRYQNAFRVCVCACV